MGEVKHSIELPGDGVGRAIPDSAQIPVVFDEPKDGRLMGYLMIDVIATSEGRYHQQRHPRTVSATTVLKAASITNRLRRSAVAGSKQLDVSDIGLIHDRAHLVVVPAIGVIISDDHRCLVPLIRFL